MVRRSYTRKNEDVVHIQFKVTPQENKEMNMYILANDIANKQEWLHSVVMSIVRNGGVLNDSGYVQADTEIHGNEAENGADVFDFEQEFGKRPSDEFGDFD